MILWGKRCCIYYVRSYREFVLGISFNKFFENWDKRLETETIDEFRRHLKTSLLEREEGLEKEYSGLTVDQFDDPQEIDGCRAHIGELMSEIVSVQYLADELSIVALYKQVEQHLKRVIMRKFPSVKVANLHIRRDMKEFVRKHMNSDLEKLNNFSAYEELQLINNAIKHQGKVTEKLAEKFPSWGKTGDELTELGAAYLRLLPLTKNYVQSFVSLVYVSSK